VASWKDELRKTGLPFEFFVDSILTKQKFYTYTEFQYLRENETGRETEFSVDFEATYYVGDRSGNDLWAALELLVECKDLRAATWIFAPSDPPSPASADPTPHLRVLDKLSAWDTTAPETLVLKGIPDCYKGTTLGEGDNKGTGDLRKQRNTMQAGLYQLRYATPNRVRQIYDAQLREYYTEDSLIRLFAPILVTTARLMVLRPGLDAQQYDSANALEDVAEQVSVLRLSQITGPDLAKYSKATANEFHQEQRAAAEKLRIRQEITQPKSSISEKLFFDLDFRNSGDHLLITTFEYFPTLLKNLKKLAAKTKAKRIQVFEQWFEHETGPQYKKAKSARKKSVAK
jgi:hypothetical protein